MIQGSMGTVSSVKVSALSFACFSAVVMHFVAGAKTARVVYPRLLEERSSDGGMMVKVHDDLTLNLRKGSVAARELRVLTEENGRLVTRFYNGEDIERNLYEDEKNIASVMVTKTGNGVRMEDAYVDRQEGYLYDRGTVNKLQSYAQAKKSAYGNPDFVYLFTGEDLYTRYGGYLTAAGLEYATASYRIVVLSGIAFVASVCESTFVGLGEDEAGLFTGMHTFTHETCHILGARHDGSDPDAGIPGHPGSKNCPWDDGYMMSYVNKGPNHQVFSWCSLQQMEFVVRLRGPKCWAHGDEENVVEHVYPGMAVSMKEFCMNIYREDKSYVEFDKSEVNPMTCRVKCRYNKYTWYDYYRTNPETMTREDEALDHTPCGKDMVKQCLTTISLTDHLYLVSLRLAI
ncbi:uncharacterized protein LOC119402510 [Rhipicephalus sanguineus]|uniref:uncharacterized protein LOC119402510 n=1 Tax=Rhipicephalus sanguineus TaxID=34632 RepID=UPI0020C1EDCB|nr:uncharacterized protein LOC119402510 [Rhipicephalus sanguineus]